MTDNEKLERALANASYFQSRRDAGVFSVPRGMAHDLIALADALAASEARVEAVEGQRDALLAKLVNSTGHDVVFGPTVIRHDPGRCLICDTRRDVLDARSTEETP